MRKKINRVATLGENVKKNEKLNDCDVYKKTINFL